MAIMKPSGYQLLLAVTLTFIAWAQSQTTPLFPVACELNVLIVLDRSDSVKGGFNKSRKFVTDVSDELQIGPHKHRVAMIVYSGNSYRREIFRWNFAKSNEEFIRITNSLRAIGGTTNTQKALEVAVELMSTRNKTIPTLILVVTDGRSAEDPKPAGLRLQAEANTWIFTAATGDPEKVDKQELLDITGNINHIVLHRGRELATDITRRLLRQAQEKCRTTTTTTTTTTNPITGCEMDLVLVMDFSTTTDPIYQFYKDMAVKLVSALKIGPHHTQVAGITFSTVGRTRTQFNLKKHHDQADVIRAIHDLKSRGGTTALGAGIRQALTQMSEREGGRPGIATRVMVVFTDGWSNKGPDPEASAREAIANGFEIYSVSFNGKVANAVTTNTETLESVVQDKAHNFNENNFDQLIAKVRQRNVPCM